MNLKKVNPVLESVLVFLGTIIILMACVAWATGGGTRDLVGLFGLAIYCQVMAHVLADSNRRESG